MENRKEALSAWNQLSTNTKKELFQKHFTDTGKFTPATTFSNLTGIEIEYICEQERKQSLNEFVFSTFEPEDLPE